MEKEGFTGDKGQSCGILVRVGSLQTVILAKGSQPRRQDCRSMCAQCLGLTIRWAFLLTAGGTQCVWFHSQIRRIAIIQPGDYEYVDHPCAIFCVSFFCCFSAAVAFYRLSGAEESWRTSKLQFNSLIPDAEGDIVSLGSIILVLPEFSFS